MIQNGFQLIDWPMYHRDPGMHPRSRGSTGRTSGRPLGDQSYASVRNANVMIGRVVVLCLLASAKACWWTVEQPSSSLMERHPTFQRLLKLLTVRKLNMSMGDYGAPSRKATVLYSSSSAIPRQFSLFWPRPFLGEDSFFKYCIKKEIATGFKSQCSKFDFLELKL